MRINPPETARFTFDQKAMDKFRPSSTPTSSSTSGVSEDAGFKKDFLDWLFERYRAEAG